MNGALTGIVLVLLWGIVAARLPTLWRDAQQRAMWSTLCTLAVTKTVATPGVIGLIGELVPNAQIIPHLLAVLTAFLLLRFLSLITGYDAAHARAARYQMLLVASVLTTLVILMAVTPGGIRTRGTELMNAPTGPAAVAYWVVLNGYLGTVLVIATALFWRISRSAPDRLLRNSLRAMASGTLLVAVYAVLKTGLIVAHSFDVTMSIDRIEPVANALRTIGIIICLIGAVVPAGGRLRSVIRAYRALWELRPLWNVMRRAFPDVILFPRRRALLELAGVDEVQLRLYRRVIEIRDGMLTLRDYLPAGALAEARAYVGDNPPLIEACGIALALRRHRSGAKPADHGATSTKNDTTQAATSATSAMEDVTRAETPATSASKGSTQLEMSATSTRDGTTTGTPAENGATTAQSGDRWADIGGEIEDEVAWLSAVSAAYRRRETAAFAERQLAAAAHGTEMTSAHRGSPT